MNTKHVAKKMTRAGSTPVWEYRGVRVVKVDGTLWGRGWIFNDPYAASNDIYVVRYSTTLQGAKWDIDYALEGMN